MDLRASVRPFIQSFLSSLGFSEANLRIESDTSGAREASALIKAKLRSPGQAFSLSHTQNYCLGISLDEPDTRIGIDLELRDRKISEKAALWIRAGEALAPEISELELWVIKEACFKALPKNEGKVIAQLHLVEWDPKQGRGIAQGFDPGGESRVFFRLFSIENLWCAFAVGRFGHLRAHSQLTKI